MTAPDSRFLVSTVIGLGLIAGCGTPEVSISEVGDSVGGVEEPHYLPSPKLALRAITPTDFGRKGSNGKSLLTKKPNNPDSPVLGLEPLIGGCGIALQDAPWYEAMSTWGQVVVGCDGYHTYLYSGNLCLERSNGTTVGCVFAEYSFDYFQTWQFSWYGCNSAVSYRTSFTSSDGVTSYSGWWPGCVPAPVDTD